MNVKEDIEDLCTLPCLPSGYRLWSSFMKKHDCRSICELGVQEGENFMRMIEHRPEIAVAVDSWIEDGNAGRNDCGYTQKELDAQYESFKVLVKDKPFVQVCREYTFDAAKHFPDEYFDLIYIDADHTYEACLKDIEDWYPKIKKGRFLTGDDYWDVTAPETGVRFEVIRAVNQFAETHDLRVHELPEAGWAIIKR